MFGARRSILRLSLNKDAGLARITASWYSVLDLSKAPYVLLPKLPLTCDLFVGMAVDDGIVAAGLKTLQEPWLPATEARVFGVALA